MKITKILKEKNDNIYGKKSGVIAFLGDSVTQGCFEVFFERNGNLDTVFDTANSYSSLLKQKLEKVYPKATPIIVNAGLSGGSAPNGLQRLERDVLKYSPDLTIVCFGLNDCQRGRDGINTYTQALKDIFKKLKEFGSDVIFMTPNMLCTNIHYSVTDQRIIELIEKNIKNQQDGILDFYVESAVKTAMSCGVYVCDCYSKWKTMYENGVDTTTLLANYINHPTREMHNLFSDSLFELIMNIGNRRKL